MKNKRLAIILNEIALQKKVFLKTILPAIQESHYIELLETKAPGDASDLSAEAVKQGRYDAIIAAGGNGTLNQVVTGVLTSSNPTIPIGLVPLGSANDFARSVRLKADVNQVLGILQRFTTKKINVGSILYKDFHEKDQKHYFINVADIGMGPEVVTRVIETGRSFGPAIAYYKSILETFFTYRTMVVNATSAEWTWSGKLRSLAIANGKYYGNGLCIAPDAKLDDDLFSVFICGNVSVLDFIRYSDTLKRGKYVVLPEVLYRTCTTLDLTSESPCLIQADGELLGRLPAKIELTKSSFQLLH